MASRFTGLEPSQFFRMGLPIKLVYPSPVDTMDKVHVRVENVARTIVTSQSILWDSLIRRADNEGRYFEQFFY
jgi:hypothetical protein